ncbi:MAG: GxxExxY protein [Cytophagales bacterium]|nr:MAG: GxxExxY protein [Cytophagales bacterium]
MEKLLHQELTDKIIGTYYDVYNTLGYAFMEKVYQNAMYFELNERGFEVEAQKLCRVYYKKYMVGEFYPDIIVDNSVILELKATESLVYANEIQLLNYLRATNIEVGLLLNFGKKPQIKRLIFTNDKKPNYKPI